MEETKTTGSAEVKEKEKGPDLAARAPGSRYEGYREAVLSPPAGPVNADLTVPGSKSLTNRALILAALAEGESTLSGILNSDDSYWCIGCLTALGVGVDAGPAEDTVIVRGTGGRWPVREGDLYVGSAGTVARFLPGALAAGEGVWRLTGSRRMSERPLAPLLAALRTGGADIRFEGAEGCLPFTMRANGLQGGETVISGSVSSQFISGLLIAAPYARETMTVRIDGPVVQRAYVEMTLDMMHAFGSRPEVADDGQTIVVPPGRYEGRTLQLEPDVSTCGYFWALAALTGGRVRIEGIRTSTRQPDIELLELLERMGCSVTRGGDFIEVTGGSRLRGGFTVNMGRWSDQTLTVAALAVFADGPVTMTDAAHIRHHECDRIAAICEELGKLGIRVEEHPDGLTVHPGEPRPALVDSHDDHRMAMALSLIGVRTPGIRIGDPGCVSKTCPDYFDRLAALGVGVAFR
ncbi:3-phosphoshikimate 1-carboxyvinyltransferase [Paenibacillus sp. J31TS4]|uniref:3-phosphoshikimate 1-carboxyvinyltransferase n=1 Tax=Paenibacillus sp. J31TS4 TaxID=2807195 RepID=UPI001B02823C|nr:3-phosphoshikimate 1-carboxyvinyltransferase [Paenibacillus sp. J31TS4]GIP39352.1 3-phosphoshikimate 1-carboxyvinyltransferase [Paenibacillus sp. J31TS4]